MSDLPGLYRRFAEEAAGRSPLYAALALAVAGDEAMQRVLGRLPPGRRQPHLLFAAFRHLFGTPADPRAFRTTLLARPDAVRSVMLARATQTNEPARCALLLPVLARLPAPLALIEAGASAGLCLLPDRYGYDYGGARLPAPEGGPVFSCAAGPGVPLPAAPPMVAWRAGLDLHPLDPASPTDAAWLETLVWPGQERRLDGLRLALRLAARERPRVVAGDLLGEALPALCREAPRGATRVLFHVATLAHVADARARSAFARRAPGLADAWISCEGPEVFPEIAARVPRPGPAGALLLALDGRPLAWADPHGAWLDWFAEAA